MNGGGHFGSKVMLRGWRKPQGGAFSCWVFPSGADSRAHLRCVGQLWLAGWDKQLEAADMGTENDLDSKRYGFIGAGNMAQALAKAMVKHGNIKADRICVSAPSKRNFKPWELLGAKCTHSNREVVMTCDIIFLAVKPHLFKDAVWQARLEESTEKQKLGKKLFISVIGGVPLERLVKYLQCITSLPAVVRAMPNTPVELGAGCIVFTMGPNTTEEDSNLTEVLLSCGGLCKPVPESHIDAYCGLIGSGTAFVFATIEALSDGGVKMGIPRHMATRFAAQMMMGSAKMVLESERHPAELKDAVCSPGGTTIAGVHALEKGSVRAAFMDAVEAATKRAQELGKQNN